MSPLRRSLRFLVKNPTLSAVTIVVLAVSIGANTIIFSVVNSVLLRPLPFAEPDRLVMVYSRHAKGDWDRGWVRSSDFLEYKNALGPGGMLAAYSSAAFDLVVVGTDGGLPERVHAHKTFGGFFDVLGISPLLGRTFLAEEQQPGRDRVVIVSHGFWRRALGMDETVVGQEIRLSGRPYTVIGVMPEEFWYPDRLVELWVPMAPSPERLSEENSFFFQVISRLPPGTSATQIEAKLKPVAARLRQQFPATHKDLGIHLGRMDSYFLDAFRTPLLLLQGAILLVLLLASADLGSFLHACGVARRKEFATRTALGANRRRIICQVMTESLLMTLAGGVLGGLFALWGLRIFVTFVPPEIPRLDEVELSAASAVFTLVLALLAGLLVALRSALDASRVDVRAHLDDDNSGTSVSLGQRRSLHPLIAFEVALALVLMVAAGLLWKSFANLRSIDLGFDTRNLLTIQLQPRYREPASHFAFYDRVLEASASVPGVRSVGIANPTPLGGYGNYDRLQIEDRLVPEDKPLPMTGYRTISPGYLRTLGVPLRRGRLLSDDDGRLSTPAVVINESAALQFWPGEDPLEKRITLGTAKGLIPWAKIVGIVADIRDIKPREEPGPLVYLPNGIVQPGRSRTLVVRTDVEAGSLLGPLRAELARIDPDVPPFNMATMEERIHRFLASERYFARLFLAFAAFAISLAAVAVYGIVSHSVRLRVHEMGIRLALGAQRYDLIRLTMRQTMVWVGLGLAAGTLIGFAATQLLSNTLYEVQAADIGIFLRSALLLLAVTLLASFLPSYASTGVDPVNALRSQ